MKDNLKRLIDMCNKHTGMCLRCPLYDITCGAELLYASNMDYDKIVEILDREEKGK